jgi:hypothetical protein
MSEKKNHFSFEICKNKSKDNWIIVITIASLQKNSQHNFVHSSAEKQKIIIIYSIITIKNRRNDF